MPRRPSRLNRPKRIKAERDFPTLRSITSTLYAPNTRPPNIRPTRLIAKKRGCPTRKLRQPSSYRNYRKGRALPLFILEHSLQRHGQEPGRCCCRHSPHQSDCKHQPSSMHCRHRYLHPKESPRDSPYATDG